MMGKYFETTESIEASIREKDRDSLIAILVGVINRDPTFATTRFDEAYRYISDQSGLVLYEDKIHLELEYKNDVWDKDYFRMQLVWLQDNFCRERVEYIKQVGMKVYENEHTPGKDEAKRRVCENEHTSGKNDAGNFQNPVGRHQQQEPTGYQVNMALELILAGVLLVTFLISIKNFPKEILVAAEALLLILNTIKLMKKG